MARKKSEQVENAQIENPNFSKQLDKYKTFLQKCLPEQFNVSQEEDIIKTGFTLYDEIIGGIPKGKYILISSEPGQGKTTLLVQLQQVLQRQFYNTMYIDTETSMSIRRMETLGLDVDKTIYVVPDQLEDCYQLIIQQMKKKEIDRDNTPFVFCFDSNTQQVPRKELEEDDLTKNSGVQLQPRINSQALKKIIQLLKKTDSTLIMIQQVRSKLNTGGFSFGGPQNDITGGQQISFYPHINVQLSIQSQKELESFEFEGRLVKFKQKKNRIQSPNIDFYMQLDFEKGFVNSVSNFVFLKNLTKQDWKKSGYEEPQFFSTGGWWNFKYEDIDMKFRQQEFIDIYNNNENFRNKFEKCVIEIIRCIYKHEKQINIQTIDDIEKENEIIETMEENNINLDNTENDDF